ncbi:MAG: hypothetical protein ACLSUW_02510 [Akkermansia sp.]
MHGCFRAGNEAGCPVCQTSKPNVIFILVDDMGWGDLDSNWSQQKLNGRTVERKNEFKTPALSALAREGFSCAAIIPPRPYVLRHAPPCCWACTRELPVW